MEFIGVKILVVVPIVVVFTCPLSHLYLLKTFVFYSLHLQTSILKTKTMDLPPLDFLFDFELWGENTVIRDTRNLDRGELFVLYFIVDDVRQKKNE